MQVFVLFQTSLFSIRFASLQLYCERKIEKDQRLHINSNSNSKTDDFAISLFNRNVSLLNKMKMKNILVLLKMC